MSTHVETPQSASFGARLGEVFARYGRLCVGIDPHRHLLDDWGLADTAVGAREFGLKVVDAAAGSIGLVKPQIAFFERFGSAGYCALEEVLDHARSAGLLVIADVKRGDIGSTMDAYAEAWLTPGSPLEADAITATAYVGVGALGGAVELAARHGKGVFVLAATSNPEAGTLQRADSGGSTVAGSIAREVHELSREDEAPIGHVGLVLGATQDLATFGVDPAALAVAPAVPVLAPGFGAQGAHFDDIPATFGALAASTIVAVSRSVLAGGAVCLPSRIASDADALAEVGA